MSRLIPENIPKELRDIPQWVIWRYEVKGEGSKPTKVPYQALRPRLRASKNNQVHWASFEDTVASYQANKASGIGFCTAYVNKKTGELVGQGDFIFGDIDHCIKDGVLNELAKDVLKRLNPTYFEQSPSETGLRFVIKAEMAKNLKSNKLGLELYYRDWYLTFTGLLFEGSAPQISDRQLELNQLIDQYFKRTKPASHPVVVKPILTQESKEPVTEWTAEAILDRLGDEVHGAGRNDTAYYLASQMRDNNIGEAECERALVHNWLPKLGGDHPFTETELRSAIASAYNGNSRDCWSLANPSITNNLEHVSVDDIPKASIYEKNGRSYHYYDQSIVMGMLGCNWDVASIITPLANAHRVLENHQGQLAHNPELGWLSWTSTHWAREESKAFGAVKRISKTIRHEVDKLHHLEGILFQAERDKDARALHTCKRELRDWAIKCERPSEIRNTLKMAESDFRVERKAFEYKPWVIGFQNGTWTNGQFREHRKADYLLELCPISYNPDADRTQWLEVLKVITGNDPEFARTLQSIAGYALSGSSRLKFLLWLYGARDICQYYFTHLIYRQATSRNFYIKG